MEKEKRILEEVEKTMHALDLLPKLEGNPYLFTRVQAVISSGTSARHGNALKYVKAAAFAFIVIINLITAAYIFRPAENNTTKDKLIYSLSSEYNSSLNEF